MSQLCISLVVEFLVPGQPLFCILLEFSIELPFEFISCPLCLPLGPKSCLPRHDGNSPLLTRGLAQCRVVSSVI